MFDLGEILFKFLKNASSDLLKSAFKIMGEGLFDHHGLFGIAKQFYGIWIGVAALTMVCIALYRVINALLSEAEQGTEVTVSTIIIDTIKSSFMILVIPFLMYFILDNIVQPVGSWILGNMGENSGKQVQSVLKSGDIGSALGNGFVFTFTFLFIAIAVIAFVIKMCIYHADLMMLEVFSVMSAIHLASGDNSHMQLWWKEFMAQITTIIAQLLAMAIIVNILTDKELKWWTFALLIGMSVMLIRGPSFLRSMWYSTGSGSMQKKMATRLALAGLRKLT